ncbi:hypothetical protein ITJ86_16940 [Winogradskyella sp. F6397]|uniref:DUF2207 domain-containing protein n=2 Tax=Winogradskyella marina TaxID=2785530 RepID=A0ABS0EQ95_9FLAO|nr:hypothetical protein [Winogradskyella marina]
MNFSRHCDLCENRMTSLGKGISCKLTNKKPYFNNTCPKITLDKKFQEKLEIANLELEIIRRKQKSTHLTFYGTIIIGFLLILLGYFLSDWKIFSLYLWYVKIGIIVAGISFLGAAYSKLNKYRRENKKAELEKNKIDEVLNKYGISYQENFEFKEKIHGTQEVIVNFEFKNWKKGKTTNTYKFDY